MIANITTGAYVKGMVLYNDSKTKKSVEDVTQALLLGTNCISDVSKKGIINSILRQNELNNNISNPNIHISINFHENDIIDNNTIFSIAKDYMESMNYGEQPYAIYRHFDTNHPHIHIVSTQINTQGKFIDDSFLYRRSQAITRKLEIKYNTVKALESKSNLNQHNIQENIHDYLNGNTQKLSSLLDKILTEAINERPTSFKELDYKLKKFNVLRVEGEKGHSFKIVPLEYFDQPHTYTKSKALAGSKIDSNFSLSSLSKQLELNLNAKDHHLKNVQGRFYSIYNNLSAQILLSDLITLFNKKGLNVRVKRRQSGVDSGKINGFIFIDSKTNLSYTATDLKLKSTELSKLVIDDKRNTIDINTNSIEQENRYDSIDLANEPFLDSNKDSLIGDTNAIENQIKKINTEDPVEASINFDYITDTVSLLLSNNYASYDQQVSLKRKKRKKKPKK